MSGQARRREQVPEQLKAAARKSPNFGRLYAMQPLLAIYGAQAEQSVFTNPNVSYVASGQFGELLAAELVQRAGVRVEGTRQIDRLAGLQRAGLLPGRTRDAFDTLRGARPYRPAISREDACSFLRAGSGSQFDPKIVRMCGDGSRAED